MPNLYDIGYHSVGCESMGVWKDRYRNVAGPRYMGQGSNHYRQWNYMVDSTNVASLPVVNTVGGGG